MKKQKVVWTALPNGFAIGEDGQRLLQLSVFVAPRLETNEGLPEPHLNQFPDFAKNWTKKVSSLSFAVVFQNGEKSRAILDTSQLDPKLWERLFSEETYVRPFSFRDLSNRALRTYPIQGVMSYLQDQYTKIAEKSPSALPLLEPERDGDGKPVGDTDATLQGFVDNVGTMLTPEKEILCEMDGEEYYAFKRAAKEEQQGKNFVLAYIRACLKKQKIVLSGQVRISVVNELLWSIVDGEEAYFVEDTGSSILVYRYGDIYQNIDQVLKINKVLDPGKLYGMSKEALSFLQANRFYDRKEDKREFYLKPNALHVPPPPEVEKVDFHQMLAMLGDHPLLMRKLGVVLDLICPVPSDYSVKSVQVIPQWGRRNSPVSFHEDRSPITRCILNKKRFIARPQSSGSIVNGMLNLKGADDRLSGNPAGYNLLQIDPEGTALKAMRAGSSMVRQFKRRYLGTFSQSHTKELFRDGCNPHIKVLQNFFIELLDPPVQLSNDAKVSVIRGNRWLVTDKGKQFELIRTSQHTLHVYAKQITSFDTADDTGLPALQTAGIGLFKTGRAYELFHRLQDNKAKDSLLSSTTDIKLYADDLLRGYRVDVLDKHSLNDPGWRSLCRRVGHYFVGKDALNPSPDAEPMSVDDEGYVKGASTTSSDAGNSDLYLNETMFRWDGWSLVAQRPGKTIKSVETKDEVYLFTWEDVPTHNRELIAFLTSTFHARWVEKAVVQKQGTDKITVSHADRLFVLGLSTQTVTLTTDDGREYEYTVKKEGGKYKVYSSIPKQDEKIESTVNKAETAFELASVFSARPGSLPRLRFGHRYKLRARTVDIAGNSLSWQSEDDQGASESILFNRFEPLIPPTLVPRTVFTEGEAVEHLVIRSTFDQSTSEYIINSDVVNALAGSAYSYQEGNERHVVPPKTSQLLAETHSMFDEYFGEGKDYEKGYRIALKEEGTLADKAIVNIATGIKEPLSNPDVVETVIPAHDSAIPDAEVPGQYILHKEEQLVVPYLPDPISRGVTLRDVPGITASGTTSLEKVIDPGLDLTLLKVPFDMHWPESLPFRIRIEERPGHIKKGNCTESFDSTDAPPFWDAEQRVLTVYLAKAEVRTIKYSCFFNEEELEQMGIWKWLRNAADLSRLKKYGLAGTHWMMTPFREMTLVHAVQQPLCEPTLPAISGIKHSIGDTMAEIQGEMYLSAKSTDKVNLLACWTEPVDDILKPAPHTKDVHANAFDVKIETDYDDTVLLPLAPCISHNHEFGDTKYRHVHYYLTGTTRFREYFHPAISGTGKEPLGEAVLEYCFDWAAVPGADEQTLLAFLKYIRQIVDPAGATITKSSDGKIITIKEQGTILTLELNTDQNGLILHALAGIAYVFVVSLEADGKLCLHADKISRQGPYVAADILNSARPLAPNVQYILPTFGWEQKSDNGEDKGWKQFQRTRKGGGLRVYLDRPWYSSGDGELLGVTLYPHLVPDELKSYATQWGMDPIRKSKVPKGGLNIGDFDNVEKGQTNLSIAELPSVQLNVAGFAVEYSVERKLWFSDIQIDPQNMVSYFPFIRLALARYQPNSITNAHLSKIVLTDFVQVANDRTLFIERKQKGQEIHIRVEGRATGDRASNRMEVSLEFLKEGDNPEFGWQPVQSSRLQPNPLPLKLSPVDSSTHLWRWDGTLSLPRSRRTQQYRLVVCEYEQFKADANLEPSILVTVVAPSLGSHHFVQDAERMVYADIVEL